MKKIHLLFIAFVVSLGAFAQSPTATVKGKLIDAYTLNPIQQQKVELIQNASIVATTLSDTAGYFAFSQMSYGTYSFRVVAKGYTEYKRSNIVVNSSKLELAPFNLMSNIIVQDVAEEQEDVRYSVGLC